MNQELISIQKKQYVLTYVTRELTRGIAVTSQTTMCLLLANKPIESCQAGAIHLFLCILFDAYSGVPGKLQIAAK